MVLTKLIYATAEHYGTVSISCASFVCCRYNSKILVSRKIGSCVQYILGCWREKWDSREENRRCEKKQGV